MTEEERSNVLSLLLSDGSFQNKTYWENEENGMIAVYNGSQSETVAEVYAAVPHLRHLYGEGEATLSDGTVSGFGLSGGTWGDTFFFADETYTGGGALGIQTAGNAHATQSVKNMEAGKTYIFTAWVKTVHGSAAIKTEFTNTKNSAFYYDGAIRFYGSADGEWTKAEYVFTVPEGADTVGFLLRVIGGGEVYWDDLSLSDGEKEIPLTNSGFEESKGGVLTLSLPPKTLMVFGTINTVLQGVEKSNILYNKIVPGATVRCESDTWVSQYININGVKEMIGLYLNGDAMQSEVGDISFYRWDGMLRPKE